MKKYFSSLIFLSLFMIIFTYDSACAQRSADDGIGMDLIILYPGESQSINFEYNGLFWDNFAFHMALVASFAFDEEVHTLSVNITPMGDDGSEFTYFTTGFFYGAPISFEILAPRFPSGYEDVNYTVDMNPFSLGFIVSAVINEYPNDNQHDGDDFDYPIDMTMTLTLSN